MPHRWPCPATSRALRKRVITMCPRVEDYSRGMQWPFAQGGHAAPTSAHEVLIAPQSYVAARPSSEVML